MPLIDMSLLRRSLSRAFSASAATRYNVNKAILVGYVGSDCDVKQISEGRTVTTYPLATSEMKKDKEGNLIQQTQWHRIVGWNMRPTIVDKIKKGALIYLEGQILYNEYVDKAGITKNKTEVQQHRVTILKPAPIHDEESSQSHLE